MFGFKKKSLETKCIRYYSVHWNAKNPIVHLNSFIDLARENDLEVVDLRAQSATNIEGDLFMFLNFGLNGSYPNHKIFEDLCLVDGRMDYYRKLGEGF